MWVQKAQLCSKITRVKQQKQQQKQQNWLHISQGKAIHQPRHYCQDALAKCMNQPSGAAFHGLLCNRHLSCRWFWVSSQAAIARKLTFNSIGKQNNLQLPGWGRRGWGERRKQIPQTRHFCDKLYKSCS